MGFQSSARSTLNGKRVGITKAQDPPRRLHHIWQAPRLGDLGSRVALVCSRPECGAQWLRGQALPPSTECDLPEGP